jgi:hypothetical protein
MSLYSKQKDIQQLIDDKVQESLTLDYKAADALQKSEGKKSEITKDVSAMANSAGGIIIYGLSEYKDSDLSFYPEKIDPVDQSEITKEWLQQVINTIRPKIDGLVITPIEITESKKGVVYVVEIPQSSTAHQAKDYRYYKRYNALSIAMDDYEIRDIMGRSKTPQFELTFKIIKKEYSKTTGGNDYTISPLRIPEKKVNVIEYTLLIYAQNISSVVANYVNVFFKIPSILIPFDERIHYRIPEDDLESFIDYEEDNTIRDVVDYKTYGLGMASIPKYGPSRYDPILPKLGKSWSYKLDDECTKYSDYNLCIKWSLHADNANPVTGEIDFKSIPFESKKEHE